MTVDLNANADTTQPDAPADAPAAATAEPAEETPAAEAVDIDTDELESLLTDLKATKKRNKAPAKKRERKPKAAAPVVVEEVLPVVEPAAEEAPAVVEAVAAPQEAVKPKRKYAKKPQKTLETIEEPPTPHQDSEEPVKRTPGAMIEEMQRAERALRYQMRKNKMQTLVSQAFN